MKALVSPVNNKAFNTYLLKYIKRRLLYKCYTFEAYDDFKCKYTLETKNGNIEYTYHDIINSLSLKGQVIAYSNQKLVNHAVYDLCQRFWYEELKQILNIINHLYLKFVNKYQDIKKPFIYRNN